MTENEFTENVINKLAEFTASIMPKEADANEIKIFESFLAELTDADDAPPSFACRDAKYYLTIQREKMKSLGITVKDTINKSGALDNITGVMFDSQYYTAHRLFKQYNRKSVYYYNGKRIFTYKDRLVLYQTLINAKQGLSPEAGCICPSCGGLSTIAELEHGCKYCGGHFMMSELFPKVTEHYWLRGYSMNPGEMRKRMLKFVGVGVAVGIIAGLILDVTGVWKNIPDISETVEVSSVIYFTIFGAVAGFFGSLISLLGRVFIDAIKSLPLISRTSGSKKILTNAIKKHDPCFFYEAFESRILSLFKIMVYGDNFSENAAYCGDKPIEPTDVIDAVARGALEVVKIETTDNYMNITLTVFADCMHFNNGRIVRKSDEYRMTVTRSLKAVTDQGFSVIKVECPSCGGSFDATRTKHCPYCGRDYHLYDNDWAVRSFEKRNI